MALPPGLNDLAKLTLLASDASYFDNQHPAPTLLGSLDDTNYGQGGMKKGVGSRFSAVERQTMTPDPLYFLWMTETAARLGLEASLRPIGRPQQLAEV
jgi:hypothetical protein